MNREKLTADFHRSGRDQDAVGIPGNDALQSIEHIFRARLGAEREPVVEGRDEGSPALTVEELAETDLRAIHDREVSSDAGITVAAPDCQEKPLARAHTAGRL